MVTKIVGELSDWGDADLGGYPYCYEWTGTEWADTYDHAMILTMISWLRKAQ